MNTDQGEGYIPSRWRSNHRQKGGTGRGGKHLRDKVASTQAMPVASKYTVIELLLSLIFCFEQHVY